MASVIEQQNVARRRPYHAELRVVPVSRRSVASRIRSLRVGTSPWSITFEEAPVLAAFLVFAVLAQIGLAAMQPQTMLVQSHLKTVTLPASESSPIRGRIVPVADSYDVIGEVAGVDPSAFARLAVTEYTVRAGDTLSEIADRNGLSMDTLISFNQVEDVRRLQIGNTFQIPNRDGLLYTVKAGDSISAIARRFDSSVNAILDVNDLASETLREGQVVFVPGARMNPTELRIILGELFEWPVSGRFTSPFGMRADPFTGRPRFHNGIDLANSVGTPIRAAASGRIVHVEAQINNYGRFVIVRHPDGFQTLYAHLDTFNVRTGQYVDRGQVLGTMGNTGRSTGPHLHFSVIHNGSFVDPLRYLH